MATVVDAIASGGLGGDLTVLDADGAAVGLSWAEVHRRARRVAAVLAGDGFGPGSRVALVADTSVDLVVVLQAVWLAGGAVTVLPPGTGVLNRDRIRAVSADAGLDLILTDGTGPDLVVAGDGPRTTVTGSMGEVIDRAAAARPIRVAGPDPADLAVLQYTSGSTGQPRGVPVTHAHLAANLAGIRTATQHEADHPGPLLSWLPLHHDMGLIGGLALPMSCGCPLVLMSPVAFRRRPSLWLAAIDRYRPTWSGGPSFALGLLARILRGAPAADLASLRQLMLGAEPVDPGVVADFLTVATPRGFDPGAVAPAYGLAECTLAVTCPARGSGLRVDRVDATTLDRLGRADPVGDVGHARALTRLGRPIPGLAVRIADAVTGAEVAPRHVGHVEVRGTSVVGHYWREPAAPPTAWFRTGDLGYLAEGDLVICGRDKDVLFAAGRNVYPTDVEAVAQRVLGVRSGGAAAFGLPAIGGDRLVVAVESRGPEREVRRAVTHAVREEIGLTPDAVLVLAPHRLPRTSSGKLRRAETRRRYLAGGLTT
jgi:fatty-acyl-CoA synthase